MTHTKEQERAHALAEKHGATSYRNRADTSNPAFGFTLGQLEALISEVEQAARRAPVVAVPQGWKLVPEVLTPEMKRECMDSLMDGIDIYMNSNEQIEIQTDAPRRIWKFLLAAAPQPPEADHIPDAGKKVAAPENIREGAPYDNPEFEQLARDMGVWGTPQAALCAQFWLAATQPAAQGLDALDAARYRSFLDGLKVGDKTICIYAMKDGFGTRLRTTAEIDAAIAAQAKQGGA